MDIAADDTKRDDAKQRLLTALRILAILVPLAFLVKRVDPSAVPTAIGTVGISGFVTASVLQAMSIVVGSVRWAILLRAFGAHASLFPRLTELVRHFFVGLYFQMIPSGLVGEFLRAQRTSYVFDERATAYVVILVDRAAASFGLLSLGLVAVFTSDFGIEGVGLLGSLRAVLVVAWVLSAVIVAIPFGFGSAWMRAKIATVPRIGPLLVQIVAAPDFVRIGSTLALSIGIEILSSAAVVATVFPVASPGVLLGIALASPVILLLTFLPITPGALGQRELAFVTMLTPVGVAATDATAAAIVTLAVTVLMALVGFFCLVSERRPGPFRHD